MTKKDFIALAEALRAEAPKDELDSTWFLNRKAQWELDCHAVARVCKRDNPRFNVTRWFSYLNGECGPNGGKIKKPARDCIYNHDHAAEPGQCVRHD